MFRASLFWSPRNQSQEIEVNPTPLMKGARSNQSTVKEAGSSQSTVEEGGSSQSTVKEARSSKSTVKESQFNQTPLKYNEEIPNQRRGFDQGKVLWIAILVSIPIRVKNSFSWTSCNLNNVMKYRHGDDFVELKNSSKSTWMEESIRSKQRNSNDPIQGVWNLIPSTKSPAAIVPYNDILEFPEPSTEAEQADEVATSTK